MLLTYICLSTTTVVLLTYNCVSTWQPPADGGKVEKLQDSRNMETVLLPPQLHWYQGAQMSTKSHKLIVFAGCNLTMRYKCVKHK